MFFKKKVKKPEVTVEWLIEVGVPPIYAHILIKRMEELSKRKKVIDYYTVDDFRSIPIWSTDREKLVKILNGRLNA